MGYLIGFLITVYFVGKFNYESFLNTFLKLTFATSFIYILGIAWLGMLIGWDKELFKIGAMPFLLAESFKILIASLVTNKIKKIRNIF